MSEHPVYPIHESRGFSLSALSARFCDHIQARLAHFTAVNELEGLTDRQLRDIGVNRHQIEQVAAREIARLHAK